MTKDFFDDLDKISKDFNEAMAVVEKEQEDYWNSLSQEEQLKAFCCVVRRIYQGDLVDEGTFRHVLYNTFKFGPESYVAAQMAGYLEIHNALSDFQNQDELIRDFCKQYNIEDSENKIKDFFKDL